MTRTALIFGISGQDGSLMAEWLFAQGYSVVGTSRAPELARGRYSAPCWQHIPIHPCDYRSSDTVDELIAEVAPDEIYNFAAFSTGSGMYDAPVEMGEVNGLFVARILDAIERTDKSIRFCQASSSEMFGIPPASPQNERTPFAPRSPYGAAKLFAHNLIGVSRRRNDLFACSAILFNHESPRRGKAFVTRKVTSTAAAISLGLAEKLTLGDLDARRDWGDASDYVRAMWLMLQADAADDYVIATGEVHSVAELCKIAFGYLGLDWRSYVLVEDRLKRSPDPAQLVGDASHARAHLKWTPDATFRGLIERMVDADLQQLRTVI